ncbi:hypothetical protein FA95DRAFT_1594196 [Auriscalpium vulgare]|uniref:Uncharacterized protein n=1 Tax=Auriscalpium vulgare TaxID=40419 RepID=A0ACB8S2L3_9AGAM|nr:hypothetical protein FA95DRAFT_1594196 [Auriscalpium vulgare]
MPALEKYPPMGRLRMRHPQAETTEGPDKKCLGRCQLIQQYLKQKTGKMRSRKQISSRLQRLRRIYQGEAKMMALLREERLSDMSGTMQADRETTPTQGSVDSSRRSSPTPLINIQPAEDNPVHADELVLPPILDYPAASENLSNACLSMHPPSMSRRRLEANLPTLHRQVQLPPLPQFLDHQPSANTPAYTYPPPARMPVYRRVGISSSSNPCTPVDQIAHTPDAPPELSRLDRRILSHPRHLDADSRYFLPQPQPYVPPGHQYHEHVLRQRGSSFYAARSPIDSYDSPPITPLEGHAGPSSNTLASRGSFDDLLHPENAQYPSRLAPSLARRLSYSQVTHKITAVHSVHSDAPSPAIEGNFYTLSLDSLDSPVALRPFFTPAWSTSSSNSSFGSQESLYTMPPEDDDDGVRVKQEQGD